MTRPVAEIFAEAAREHWPTSSIDAMAHHHLCGGQVTDSGAGALVPENRLGGPERRDPASSGSRPVL